jgi:phenylpropionate dioxygenase-like ring-hydroxylating dioxygenase large terminal subunit
MFLNNNSFSDIPGGLDPNYFDWQEVWYPIYYLKDLDQTRPNTFTLLEKDLVIWWDKQQATWRVFIDKCPHRLAPLSEGRINEQGYLECPYHGWTFSGEGKCETIPQQNLNQQAETSQRACVQSLPTVISQGMLFVYPGTPELALKTKIPLIEPLESEPEGWICLDIFRDLPYDALTLMENVLDSSHIPYTHHKTVGNRQNAGPVELEVVESGKWGFKGIWEEGPRKGTLGKQNTIFIAPGLMWHDLTSKQFGRTITAVYATPIRKGECRLFARFPFKFTSKLPGLFLKLTPRWYSHLGQNGVLEDDQIFLHYQERYLEADGGSVNFTQAFYLPTKADLFVVELRNWVNKYQAESFGGKSLPPLQSRESLLNRYHSHTENCASCRQALTNISKLRKFLALVSILLLVFTPLELIYFPENPLLPLLLTNLLVVIGGLSWWSLGRLERQFYQGRSLPPRNQS